MTASLFPLFADLRQRRVLVVGGGSVAARKVRALLEAGAIVLVGAPELGDELAALASHNPDLQWQPGAFSPRWLDRDIWLVIAATDDATVNRAVAAAAEQRRLFVNVVDDALLSRFHIPAIVRRGLLQIAISSAGAAPMLARHLRRQLETWLDDSWGYLAELLEKNRQTIRQHWPELGARRRFFERLLNGSIPRLLRQQQPQAAEAELQRLLSEPAAKASGFVSLVGAGPGDPGLLTLHALRALNQADVILHDRLVSPDILALARRDATFIDVGKTARSQSTRQEDIHALMGEHAQAGRHVVRLKGGDAFIFGRGGEELQYLRQHGIAYEVVPGITAALACAAYSGIPLTHREHAQEVRFITAHGKESLQMLSWSALATPGQTLVFYMGVAVLEPLRQQLLKAGLPPAHPVALIENGSRPEQRVISGELQHLPALATQHAVQSPALLIVGEVAALADTLHWFGQPPLHLHTAVITADAA